MEKIFSMRRSYGNPQNQTVTVEVDKFNKLVECVYALADEVRGHEVVVSIFYCDLHEQNNQRGLRYSGQTS